VPDIGAFIDCLNDAGELLCAGPGCYKVNANIEQGAPGPAVSAGSSQAFPASHSGVSQQVTSQLPRAAVQGAGCCKEGG